MTVVCARLTWHLPAHTLSEVEILKSFRIWALCHSDYILRLAMNFAHSQGVYLKMSWPIIKTQLCSSFWREVWGLSQAHKFFGSSSGLCANWWVSQFGRDLLGGSLVFWKKKWNWTDMWTSSKQSERTHKFIFWREGQLERGRDSRILASSWYIGLYFQDGCKIEKKEIPIGTLKKNKIVLWHFHTV